jgi:hypothetical protein
MCSFSITDKVHVKQIELRTVEDHRNNVMIIYFCQDGPQTNYHPLYLIPQGMEVRESPCPACHIPNGCTEVSIEVFPSDIPHIGGLQSLRVTISGEGLSEERILT